MIFDEQISRKPDLYNWTQNFILSMHNGFWTNREFSFSSDIQDFKVALTQPERDVIIRSLATIGQLEISVKKFWAKLGDNLPHPSIIDMGYVMANTEVIHGDAYERLLEVLGIDDAFDDILKLDIIKGRVNYLRKHLHKFHADNRKQFVYSLVLFTLFVENVALFSQFYTISWFGRFKNVLKDTNKQVEYTTREECFIKGTEVLTPSGWRLLDQMSIGDSVCQYLHDGSIEDTKVLHKVDRQYSGDIYTFETTSGLKCSVTPNHDMVFYDFDGRYCKAKADNPVLIDEWIKFASYDDEVGLVTSRCTGGISRAISDYSGSVHCVTVESGAIVTRLDGKTFVAGNCLHSMIGIKLINVIKQECPELFDEELEKKILEETESAVKYEMAIIEWILGGYTTEDLTPAILENFIKNRMNDSLREIGYGQIFEIDKELLKKTTWFDEQVLGNNSTDFFNSRVTEYSKNSQSFNEEDMF